jgi:hypothetical protein
VAGLYLLVMCGLAVASRKHYTVDMALGVLVGWLVYARFQHGWWERSMEEEGGALPLYRASSRANDK